ncbi:phosphatidylethanolamine-binding protein [Corynascus novoguineensis]|uniref:Phosphatidylethanolamine-binding protein n=1 Tax=Corynascus novoguineensis TaxID=1126955 RepID=A0AAN7CSQ4_9PEZI|nr:phosphatidylethanolamine-binding protein [Corynascus novoguineensis]
MEATVTDLLSSLQRAGLLPSKVIPSDFTPSFLLNVRFPGADADTRHGALMRVSQVQSAPALSITTSNLSNSGAAPPPTTTTYTLMMIDPDAPTPNDPKFAYWRHWVVAHIPLPVGKDEAESRVLQLDEDGRVLTQYLAPGPKDESRPHRYLFLLFAEPEGGRKLEKVDVGGEEFVERRSFRADEFIERHGLRLVAVQWMLGAGDGWREE